LTSVDFPLPETPVTTVSMASGMSAFTSFRLCWRAPRIASCLPLPLRRAAGIGMLCAPKCDTVYNTAFFDELGKLGWVEGTNLAVERKDPDNRLDQLPAFAADLVQSKPDLIVAVAAQAAFAAKSATSDVPVVMFFVGDPVGLGFAASLAKPGGNMTGVSTLVPGGFAYGDYLRTGAIARFSPVMGAVQKFAAGMERILDSPTLNQAQGTMLTQLLAPRKPAKRAPRSGRLVEDAKKA